MKRKNDYSITTNIRSFIVNTNKLTLTPKNGIIGYNHLMRSGASNKPINSETAYYLLLSDLDSICAALNKYLEVELSENKLCALISYFYSNHTIPSALNLAEVNSGNLKLTGEMLFLGKLAKEIRALRAQQYKLWNDDKLEILSLKQSDCMFL
jgi:hypothetical protein